MESSFCIAVLSGIPKRMTPSGIHLERRQIYYICDNQLSHFISKFFNQPSVWNYLYKHKEHSAVYLKKDTL